MSTTPLAERMRPHTLDGYLGQEHLVGKNGALRKSIDAGILPSIILWGPPGVGKTTLANIIANQLNRPFYTLSAISSGVKDIREIIDKVKNQGLFGGNNAILFIDEIHRFSKSQQDSLLGAVEKGLITLIGATTENPSFEVNSALLSRCQVYVLKSFTTDDLKGLIKRALEGDDILKKIKVDVKEYGALLRLSGGDARKLLNILELVISSIGGTTVKITDEEVMRVVQQNPALYDKSGDQHYDIISAFIKSMRGSDPNGAVYWLARMIAGGEDPKFIARRLVIFASEDIGLANPNALLLANACFDAVSKVGMPEGRIILSQCTVFMATSVKSNASYEAINKAMDLVHQTGNLSVPLHLRNAPTSLMKDLDYGKNYQYSHSYEGNFSPQEYLPEEIKGTGFYNPGKNSREKEISQRLAHWWKNKYGYGKE